MGILDTYSAYEVRDIWRDDTNVWPEDFINSVNDVLASDLLDMWLESHNNDEYRERIREIIEDTTYGYEDEEGNEMLDFNPHKEDSGQMRLFE